ncbi:MAG: hypothetical protein KJ659_04540 [Actinobacteria bacterium]|nr:hypothetical protein [Actinomycetota bacterium]MBU1608521.1 hypothetical protein [Actinomycetota bacterium]MBU2315323.1 hypothetical protein [Actinomycetota bacterium]MBU2384753.1 hypothetical protein [Actinomycetota bacterium]
MWLFLDESGTGTDDPELLVGAVAIPDADHAERRLWEIQRTAYGDNSLWVALEHKREQFRSTGFHFTEDSWAVRDRILGWIRTARLRSYVAFSKNDPSQHFTTIERMCLMYGLLIRAAYLRYRGFHLHLVFEENEQMNGLYGPIWAQVASELGVAPESATVLIGSKTAPGLSVIDSILGVLRVGRSASAQPHERERVSWLVSNVAYLIDFDLDKHIGDRRRPIL